MPSLTEWKVPPANQPRAADYSFDLDHALSSVVGLHSIIPSDAFSADTLGTERAGNGVLIEDGLILTIGYLITEAETVWLHIGDGRVVSGHALGFDAVTGFGLVPAPIAERQRAGSIDRPSTRSKQPSRSRFFAARAICRHHPHLACRRQDRPHPSDGVAMGEA